MHFYLAAVEALYSNAVVDGTGPVWLQQVACNSTDTRLFNCARGSLGALTCGHDQDAGVNCTVLVNCSELPLWPHSGVEVYEVYVHWKWPYYRVQGSRLVRVHCIYICV